MLINLHIENAPQFVDEANSFLQANPAFSMIRRLLSSHLIDAGRLDEARKVFHDGGFIAEHCNLPEAAIRAYGKVEEEENHSSFTSEHSLAQRRTQAIQAK